MRTASLAAFLILLTVLTASAGDDPLQRGDVQRALLAIARATISRLVGVDAAAPPPLPADVRGLKRGVFVTLEVDGKVRGCRGTLEPLTPGLRDEVTRNAIAAATNDPRFPPVTARDVRRARISITVVGDVTPLQTLSTLREDAGLVVRCGDRVGVVLPFEGRDPSTRYDWGLRKAGLSPSDNCDLFHMAAVRFAEEKPAW